MGEGSYATLRNKAFANLQRTPFYAEMKEQALKINMEATRTAAKPVSSVTTKTLTVAKKEKEAKTAVSVVESGLKKGRSLIPLSQQLSQSHL